MRHIARLLAVAVTLIALALASSPVLSAKPKPKPKPSPKNQAKLGTKQLSGENAQIGTTYTLGKTSPINITLNKVEYTLEPIRFDKGALWARKDQKLMVLHYTLHNPNPRDYGIGWSTLEIFAVDANDKNWRFCADVAIEDTHEKCYMSLKPGQKVRVYTCVEVPAQGQIPKLVLQSRDKLVLRYNLRDKVTPLPASIADPADPSGTTALEDVQAQIGTTYPMRGLHMKLDTVAFSTNAVKGKSPRKGSRYLVITGTATDNVPGNARFGWSTFKPALKDADGGEIRWNGDAYFASRDDNINAEMKQGDELRFRYVFEAPESVKLKSLTLSQGDSHGYCFDLSQVQ